MISLSAPFYHLSSMSNQLVFVELLLGLDATAEFPLLVGCGFWE